MTNAMDKLYNLVAEKGHVCLGLDTDISYLPEEFRRNFACDGDAITAFNKRIIDATIDVVACYKPQIAYYEALGLEGMHTYKNTLDYLREKGAFIIADVKRGDIAKTAEMYVRAHFSGDFEVDAITVSPYMGMDTLEPFFPFLDKGKGLFSLVATSNPGSVDLQSLVQKEDDQQLYQVVGKKIQAIGKRWTGKSGYSSIGAVVGCRDPKQTVGLRQQLDSTFFLIPGYGAQGGTADDMKNYLVDGNGGVVNSSRGILLAYKSERFSDMPFDQAARAESIRMRDDILNALR